MTYLKCDFWCLIFKGFEKHGTFILMKNTCIKTFNINLSEQNAYKKGNFIVMRTPCMKTCKHGTFIHEKHVYRNMGHSLRCIIISRLMSMNLDDSLTS